MSEQPVTQILHAIGGGDPRASGELLPLVYQELRRLADAKLRHEKPGQTLEATALVHEAFLRLAGSKADDARWHGRGHFFAAAAEAMRRILIDRARQRGAAKRGGGLRKVLVDLSTLSLDDVPSEVIDLDEALTRLAADYPEKARLVNLRFFAGMTLSQAAAVMGISDATADRHWAFARAWLFNELSEQK